MQLFHQLIQGMIFFLLPQKMLYAYRHGLPINLPVEIKNMDFNSLVGMRNRWPCAYAEHTFFEFPVYFHVNSKNTMAKANFFRIRIFQVGRRVPELSAQLIALNYAAFEEKLITQQFIGSFHLATRKNITEDDIENFVGISKEFNVFV